MNNKKTVAARAALAVVVLSSSACESHDPTQSTDLRAWWTADSIALRDGDTVENWQDKSVNRHDATATRGHQPSYKIVDGVPLLHFGGDDYMAAPAADDWRFLHDGSSEWSIFVVVRTMASQGRGSHVLLGSGRPTAGNRVFGLSYEDASIASRNDAVRLSVAETNAAAPAVDMATDDDSLRRGHWSIISATFKPAADGSANEGGLFINGQQRVSGSKPLRHLRARDESELNIGSHAIGNALPIKADLREILIYNRSLSDAEHYDVLQRLASKLGSGVKIRYPSSRHWIDYDPGAYQAFGIAFRIPSTGKLMTIARKGLAHRGGSSGEVRAWESTDFGSTWKGRLLYDSEYDDRNIGGGIVARTGTILFFFGRSTGDEWVDMRAMRSTDSGETFSDIGAALPTNSCVGFSPYGPMIELPSGRLLQTFYGREGATGKVWISESVDDGLTWTYKADIYRGPLLINETSLAWLSGSDDATSTVLAVSRNDLGAGLVQFISTDGGNTWASQGVIPDGTRADVSPWLYRLSGDRILLAYHERYGMTYPIRLGQGSDVAANASNWSAKRAISIYRPATTVFGQSGYPSVLSATGQDDDLIEVAYDAVPGGNGNLMVQPISLP